MSLNVRLLLAFFSIYLVWGSTYLAIRLAVETIPPLATAGVRHLTAGLILYVWARGWLARVTWTEWRATIVVAVLFFLIGHGTLHWAERIVPSGIAALLVATAVSRYLCLRNVTASRLCRARLHGCAN